MLEIKDLHVSVGGNEILKGIIYPDGGFIQWPRVASIEIPSPDLGRVAGYNVPFNLRFPRRHMIDIVSKPSAPP